MADAVPPIPCGPVCRAFHRRSWHFHEIFSGLFVAIIALYGLYPKGVFAHLQYPLCIYALVGFCGVIFKIVYYEILRSEVCPSSFWLNPYPLPSPPGGLFMRLAIRIAPNRHLFEAFLSSVFVIVFIFFCQLALFGTAVVAKEEALMGLALFMLIAWYFHMMWWMNPKMDEVRTQPSADVSMVPEQKEEPQEAEEKQPEVEETEEADESEEAEKSQMVEEPQEAEEAEERSEEPRLRRSLRLRR